MATLYELTDDYKQFNEYANDLLDSDEVTEEDLEMLIDTLDAIQDSIENKAGNTAAFLKSIAANIEVYKSEEKRLAQKRKTLENKFNRIKDYAFDMLKSAGIKKVQSGVHGFRIQKSPPSVNVIDPKKVPDTYKTVLEPKIETRVILADLKDGKDITGVELITDREHIRIL